MKIKVMFYLVIFMIKTKIQLINKIKLFMVICKMMKFKMVIINSWLNLAVRNVNNFIKTKMTYQKIIQILISYVKNVIKWKMMISYHF